MNGKFNKLTARDLDLKGKRVLTRVDFNVPLLKDGSISDDTRIVASLPTIRHMVGAGGKVILMSHLGRPKGKALPEMSLRPVAKRLGELLGKPVQFVSDCISGEAREASSGLKDGEVLLLENLRFYTEEEKNDEGFSAKLGELGEVYVNDAFGTAHRAHASTVGVTRFMKQSAAGFLMEKEIRNLGKLLHDPEKPFAGILGGAKVSDKVKMISNLLGTLDMLLIGGAMMFTFLRANGKRIGKSFFEENSLDKAAEVMKKAKEAGTELILPVDCVVSESTEKSVGTRAASCDSIPDSCYGVDIGPETRKDFSNRLRSARTVFWNGPLGIFEVPEFSEGTVFIARVLGELGEQGSTTVIGGGDSASAVSLAGVEDKITHISTGGGASLEFLEGLELPGVAALTEAP